MTALLTQKLRSHLSGKRYIVLIGLLLLLAPIESSAIGLGDILSLIKTITGTLQDAVGGVLSEIQGIQTAVNQYRQQVVWPLDDLNRVRSFVGATRAQYARAISQIQSIKNNSATLNNPKQLESTLRGSGSNGLEQFQQLYTQVYASVPDANAARPIHRNIMDLDDAMAMDALKTTMVSDQNAGRLLKLADSIEQRSINSAPGSAPMLSTQAHVTDLVAQAQMQKMLAAELRQEAARLAHQNSLLKLSARTTRNLQNQMQQVLKHQ